jgi:hypothetical protein
MFTKTIIKRTTETNSDVSNTPPTAKQDCSDVVHISVFLMVQVITKMLMKKKEMVKSS